MVEIDKVERIEILGTPVARVTYQSAFENYPRLRARSATDCRLSIEQAHSFRGATRSQF